MLKTIDWFIIKKFLTAFFFSLLLCSMIAMAIDASDKIQPFTGTSCTLKNIFVDYYFGFVMHMSGLLLPLYTLIAVVFFTSRMASNSEIISIFNAGASFRRLLRPYLVAATFIALLHFMLAHFIIPKANQSRLWFERTFVWTDKEQVRGSKVHFQVAPDVKVYAQSYDKNSKIARTFRIEEIKNNKITSLTEARSAKWVEETGKWSLDGYTIRTFDGLKEGLIRMPSGRLDTLLDLTPNDFIFYHNQNEEMTTPELNKVIERDARRGLANVNSFDIEKQRRTAEPVTNIILTVIGLALAGRKVRGGMGLHLALGIGIGGMYIILSRFAVTFATSGLLPITLGMWVPNIVFGLIAVYLVSQSQN